MLVSLALAAVLHAPAAAPTRAPHDPPPHDLLSYDALLVLGDSAGHVLGQIETTWIVRAEEPVRLRVWPKFRVVRTQVDGARGQWGREGELVLIPHRRQPGDTVQIRLRYHGFPPPGWTLPEPENTRTPVPVAFHVEVPPGWRGVAPGTLEKVDTLPRGRLVWNYRTPAPTPLAALQASPPTAEPPGRER